MISKNCELKKILKRASAVKIIKTYTNSAMFKLKK